MWKKSLLFSVLAAAMMLLVPAWRQADVDPAQTDPGDDDRSFDPAWPHNLDAILEAAFCSPDRSCDTLPTKMNGPPDARPVSSQPAHASQIAVDIDGDFACVSFPRGRAHIPPAP